MKRFIFPAILLFSILSLTGQNLQDSITVKKKFFTHYQQNNLNLTRKQLFKVLESDPATHVELNPARKNYHLGYLFACSGALLISWPLIVAIAYGDPNWNIAAVGAGLGALSIPFSIAYTRHAKNAIHIYNRNLGNSYQKKNNVVLSLNYNGAGVQINF